MIGRGTQTYTLALEGNTGEEREEVKGERTKRGGVLERGKKKTRAPKTKRNISASSPRQKRDVTNQEKREELHFKKAGNHRKVKEVKENWKWKLLGWRHNLNEKET